MPAAAERSLNITTSIPTRVRSLVRGCFFAHLLGDDRHGTITEPIHQHASIVS